MIVKNDKNSLRRCLESVNEIVIIYAGSIDKIKEVALEFNVKVFISEWDNDFSNARNYALRKLNS